MMNITKRNLIILTVAITIAVVTGVTFILSGNSEAKGIHTEYECDVI